MTLIERILREMQNDDANDSVRLEAVYLQADDKGKAVLDAAMICLCGWSLETLLKRPWTGDGYHHLQRLREKGQGPAA